MVAEGRLGYAYAGSLDPEVVADVLAEARDNARYSAPDEWNGLPSLADARVVVPPSLDLWRDDLAAVPTTEKVALALALERTAAGLDPRVRGVESASYGDAASESALASSLGIEATSRRTVCSCSVSALAGEGDPALKDALRGLLALSFERAGVVEAARPYWLALRAAAQPGPARWGPAAARSWSTGPCAMAIPPSPRV